MYLRTFLGQVAQDVPVDVVKFHICHIRKMTRTLAYRQFLRGTTMKISSSVSRRLLSFEACMRLFVFLLMTWALTSSAAEQGKQGVIYSSPTILSAGALSKNEENSLLQAFESTLRVKEEDQVVYQGGTQSVAMQSFLETYWPEGQDVISIAFVRPSSSFASAPGPFTKDSSDKSKSQSKAKSKSKSESESGSDSAAESSDPLFPPLVVDLPLPRLLVEDNKAAWTLITRLRSPKGDNVAYSFEFDEELVKAQAERGNFITDLEAGDDFFEARSTWNVVISSKTPYKDQVYTFSKTEFPTDFVQEKLPSGDDEGGDDYYLLTTAAYDERNDTWAVVMSSPADSREPFARKQFIHSLRSPRGTTADKEVIEEMWAEGFLIEQIVCSRFNPIVIMNKPSGENVSRKQEYRFFNGIWDEAFYRDGRSKGMILTDMSYSDNSGTVMVMTEVVEDGGGSTTTGTTTTAATSTTSTTTSTGSDAGTSTTKMPVTGAVTSPTRAPPQPDDDEVPSEAASIAPPVFACWLAVALAAITAHL